MSELVERAASVEAPFSVEDFGTVVTSWPVDSEATDGSRAVVDTEAPVD